MSGPDDTTDFTHPDEVREQESIEEFQYRKRTWGAKFRDAFLGLRQSIYQQSSYRVHFFFALAVSSAAWWFGFDTIRWCLIVLCIGVVIAAEMFNTAIETLAKAITDRYDERVGRALNIASGAVLVISFTAAIIGTILFLEALSK